MFWFFSLKVCETLVYLSEVKPTPPALEGKVLTTGSPGKFPSPFVKYLGDNV